MSTATTSALTARAEIAWLDTEHCRSRADDYCAMPGSFLQAYLAQHQAQVPVPHTSPVPEPAALPLLLAGLAVLGWVARRRIL